MSKIFVERAALWVAITLAVVMATLPKPPKLFIDQFGDKFEHMLAFAVIALLAALAYPKARLTRIAERLSFLGALIEVVQSIPALHRDCDIMDWVADTSSIIVMLTIVALVRWSKRTVRR
ncbi:MAG: hypothetical protein JWL66_30 [Sphingomonadales bacterium]|nr:hypothetical protein [Sphingomonadales bacterium]